MPNYDDYMCKYNAESPKLGSNRFNSNAKTKYINIAELGIIYLLYAYCPPFSLFPLFSSFSPLQFSANDLNEYIIGS